MDETHAGYWRAQDGYWYPDEALPPPAPTSQPLIPGPPPYVPDATGIASTEASGEAVIETDDAAVDIRSLGATVALMVVGFSVAFGLIHLMG
ncbi:MAG TPA: hypothetical protein PLV93_13705, partial [Microthrixaceae bacterium]|nr:hypothetical protein [Microthrixaceae bacterium]HNI36452.1 hypothetical protein [Microthrixaceae bacterium]